MSPVAAILETLTRGSIIPDLVFKILRVYTQIGSRLVCITPCFWNRPLLRFETDASKLKRFVRGLILLIKAFVILCLMGHFHRHVDKKQLASWDFFLCAMCGLGLTIGLLLQTFVLRSPSYL